MNSPTLVLLLPALGSEQESWEGWWAGCRASPQAVRRSTGYGVELQT